MLKKLYIKNFTLIDTLNINFCSGFSVITGETGAGKSIILGAIGLLLGQRADSKMIKDGTSHCIVEAHFDISKYNLNNFFDKNELDYEPEDCIIRRELTNNGKSRSFINDTPASLNLLKELGEQLIDIHSQHQNLLLQKDDFQLNVIDTIAASQKLLSDYKNNYNNFKKYNEQLEQLKYKIENDKKNYDFIKFQFDELSNANLKEGEQENLENLSESMNHYEEIKSALFEADNALQNEEYGAINQIKSAQQQLDSIRNVQQNAGALADRLKNCLIEIKDIAEDVDTYKEKIDFDPAELERINTKLDKIYSLQQKYHLNDTKGLIDLTNNLQHQLDNLDNSDVLIKDIQIKVDELSAVCIKESAVITKKREKAAKKIEEEMTKRLIPLGLPNVRFKIQLEKKPISNDGADKASFLFSANPGTKLQPISQIASGGEIARVMLSLKAMISGTVKLPTIIFDEIDIGVSGKIAEKMARIMQEMGEDRQVISITHLPQIAALGTTHYKVYKEQSQTGTSSRMIELTPDERIKEIAQMLSGSNITNAALENAKELLNSNII